RGPGVVVTPSATRGIHRTRRRAWPSDECATPGGSIVHTGPLHLRKLGRRAGVGAEDVEVAGGGGAILWVVLRNEAWLERVLTSGYDHPLKGPAKIQTAIDPHLRFVRA